MSTPQHSDPPLPDYDHLPVPALSEHIRALSVHQLGQLLDYERAHANRPAVTRAMDARLAELRSGAEGSGATPDRGPEWPAPTRRTSAAGPQTAGPPASAPPHRSPAQPARPKGNRQVP